MMYGHVDTPAHWVAHLQAAGPASRSETGGFTEFVPLPFVHHERADLPRRAGPARADDAREPGRARDGAASCCTAASTTSSARWVKLGTDGCATMLRGGVNDLGGTLMEETISRMAGSGHGSRREPQELVAMAAAAGRPAQQRTTLYGEVPVPAATSA